MRRTAARLFDVAREMAGASFIVAAGAIEDVGCIIRGLQDPPPRPSAMEPPSGWCSDCETVHPLDDGALPPGLASAMFGRPRSVPQASALVASTTWEPAFASEVKSGSLLALDGLLGRRAMRVTRLLRGERPHGFGMPVPVVTFLLVDVESGEPGSLTAALDEPLTVGFEAPDAVPADLAGGES